MTILQFIEGLSDRQAADAMRSRIDWKYLLCLELSDPGVDHNEKLYWRTEEGIPPSSIMISSPYDLDAHYARKDTISWIGYKVHLSEICKPDCIHLITNVETTTAPIADGDVTECIHTSLAKRARLPSKHIVDTGYLDAEY